MTVAIFVKLIFRGKWEGANHPDRRLLSTRLCQFPIQKLDYMLNVSLSQGKCDCFESFLIETCFWLLSQIEKVYCIAKTDCYNRKSCRGPRSGLAKSRSEWEQSTKVGKSGPFPREVQKLGFLQPISTKRVVSSSRLFSELFDKTNFEGFLLI